MTQKCIVIISKAIRLNLCHYYFVHWNLNTYEYVQSGNNHLKRTLKTLTSTCRHVECGLFKFESEEDPSHRTIFSLEHACPAGRQEDRNGSILLEPKACLSTCRSSDTFQSSMQFQSYVIRVPAVYHTLLWLRSGFVYVTSKFSHWPVIVSCQEWCIYWRRFI